MKRQGNTALLLANQFASLYQIGQYDASKSYLEMLKLLITRENKNSQNRQAICLTG